MSYLSQRIWIFITVLDNTLVVLIGHVDVVELVMAVGHNYELAVHPTNIEMGQQGRSETYIFVQGGRGHWALYYTSPQSFIIKFSYSLA